MMMRVWWCWVLAAVLIAGGCQSAPTIAEPAGAHQFRAEVIVEFTRSDDRGRQSHPRMIITMYEGDRPIKLNEPFSSGVRSTDWLNDCVFAGDRGNSAYVTWERFRRTLRNSRSFGDHRPRDVGPGDPGVLGYSKIIGMINAFNPIGASMQKVTSEALTQTERVSISHGLWDLTPVPLHESVDVNIGGTRVLFVPRVTIVDAPQSAKGIDSQPLRE